MKKWLALFLLASPLHSLPQNGLSVNRAPAAQTATPYAYVTGSGSVSAYYWLSVTYPAGETRATSVYVAGMPSTLNVSNYVMIRWNAQPNATIYNVYKTATSSYPSGGADLLCQTSQTFCQDTGQSLTSGDPPAVGPSQQPIVISTPNGIPTVTANVIDTGGQVYNIKAYGAVGDGSADDTSAITNALKSARANTEGGAVLIPPGTYNVTSQILLSGQRDKLILSAGAKIECNFSGVNCIELDHDSQLYASDGGLASETSIGSASAQSFTSLIFVNGGTSQAGAGYISGITIDLANITLSNAALDICGQENGDNYKNILLWGQSGSGTFSLIHMDGNCGSTGTSNGAGYFSNISAECGNNSGCTPLLIDEGSGTGSYSWQFNSFYAEAPGTGKHCILIEGAGSNPYSGYSYNFYNVHIETGSSASAILIEAPYLATFSNVTFSTSVTTGTVYGFEIRNDLGAVNFGTVNIINCGFIASGGAATSIITNVVSGTIVSQGVESFYTWSNPVWNDTASPTFDGRTIGTGYCNSSSSPAACGSASSGTVQIAAGSSSVTVDTTAVTANSVIILTQNTRGGSCNGGLQQPAVTGASAGTSFTIAVPSTFATLPGCINFLIVN